MAILRPPAARNMTHLNQISRCRERKEREEKSVKTASWSVDSSHNKYRMLVRYRTGERERDFSAGWTDDFVIYSFSANELDKLQAATPADSEVYVS